MEMLKFTFSALSSALLLSPSGTSINFGVIVIVVVFVLETVFFLIRDDTFFLGSVVLVVVVEVEVTVIGVGC